LTVGERTGVPLVTGVGFADNGVVGIVKYGMAVKCGVKSNAVVG